MGQIATHAKGVSVSEIRKYLASIGAKGGKATGAAKVRGDSDYYRAISAKATKARAAKRKAAARAAKGKQP